MRLAEDPRLFGVQKGSRWTPLDNVAKRLLPLVGQGKVVLVEEEQADGQDGGDGDDRNHQAVKADARSLHGDDFAVSIESAECDQNGDEHGQGCKLVEHGGREVDQIEPDRRERNVVAQDVCQQIESGEDQHEQSKGGQHQEKCLEELNHNILVENAREDAAGPGALGTPLKPAQEADEGSAGLG